MTSRYLVVAGHESTSDTTLVSISHDWKFSQLHVDTVKNRLLHKIKPNFSCDSLTALNYPPDPDYDWRRPHHRRSAVHGCRLSVTELFQSPLPAPGTTCRATSRPHHLCLFLKAVGRRISYYVLCGNCWSVSAKWLPVLFTYLQSVNSLSTVSVHHEIRRNKR